MPRPKRSWINYSMSLMRLRLPSALLVAVALSAAACGGGASPTEHSADHDLVSTPTVPGARKVAITAAGFRFQPDMLRVRAGENVTILLASEDSVHDFTVDGIAHVSAKEGEAWEGGLRIDAPGRYAFYCSVQGHRARGMKGTVVVDNAEIVPITPPESSPSDGH